MSKASSATTNVAIETLNAGKVSFSGGGSLASLNPFTIGEFQIRSLKDRYGNKFLTFDTFDADTGGYTSHYALTSAVDNPKDGDYRLTYVDIARTLPNDSSTWAFSRVNPPPAAAVLNGYLADIELTAHEKNVARSDMYQDFARLLAGDDATSVRLYDPVGTSWPSFSFDPLFERRKLAIEYYNRIPFPRPVVFFSPRPDLVNGRMAIDLRIWSPAGAPFEVRVVIVSISSEISNASFQASTTYANGQIFSTPTVNELGTATATKHFRAVPGRTIDPVSPDSHLYYVGTVFASSASSDADVSIMLRHVTCRVEFARAESSSNAIADSSTSSFLMDTLASLEDINTMCYPVIRFSANATEIPYDFIYK